jgi:hypothetical protein
VAIGHRVVDLESIASGIQQIAKLFVSHIPTQSYVDSEYSSTQYCSTPVLSPSCSTMYSEYSSILSTSTPSPTVLHYGTRDNRNSEHIGLRIPKRSNVTFKFPNGISWNKI